MESLKSLIETNSGETPMLAGELPGNPLPSCGRLLLSPSLDGGLRKVIALFTGTLGYLLSVQGLNKLISGRRKTRHNRINSLRGFDHFSHMLVHSLEIERIRFLGIQGLHDNLPKKFDLFL
jgi:hypothetical protein